MGWTYSTSIRWWLSPCCVLLRRLIVGRARSDSFSRAATRRGRPPRVSRLPRRDADRRVHHADVGDRPDPRGSPDPRRARGARRAAEPPIDAGPHEPGRVTRAARPRRRPDHPLSTAPSPRHHAGTRGVGGGSPTGPSDRPPPASPSHWDRRAHGPRGARARRRARRRPSVGARAVGDRVVFSTDTNRISYPALATLLRFETICGSGSPCSSCRNATCGSPRVTKRHSTL